MSVKVRVTYVIPKPEQNNTDKSINIKLVQKCLVYTFPESKVKDMMKIINDCPHEVGTFEIDEKHIDYTFVPMMINVERLIPDDY